MPMSAMMGAPMGAGGGGAPAPSALPSPKSSTSSSDAMRFKFKANQLKMEEKKTGTALTDKGSKDQDESNKPTNQKAANEAPKEEQDTKSLKKISAKLKLLLTGSNKSIKITIKLKDWNKTIEEKLKALGLSFTAKDRSNHKLTLEATEAQIRQLAKETFVDFIDLSAK